MIYGLSLSEFLVVHSIVRERGHLSKVQYDTPFLCAKPQSE